MPAPQGTEAFSGQTVDLLLRPKSVEIALKPEELTSHVLGKGVIETITFAGMLERITIRLTDREQPIDIVLSPERARRLGIRPGDQVWVGVQDYYLLPASNPV